jgi:SanA protein
MRKMTQLGVSLFAILVLAIFGVDMNVSSTASPRLYSNVDSIPKNDVGLLLGTIKRLNNGTLNLYYKYRIEATVALFKSGKINYILVSGDNGAKDYDKPTTMMEDLVAAGIPPSRIYLDYAGFRTLDSVVRSKEVFGQKSITVISQPFHNERAIYLADANGIEAVGFNARSVSMNYGLKVLVREKLARCKMLLDLVFGAQPKYLGDKIHIG